MRSSRSLLVVLFCCLLMVQSDGARVRPRIRSTAASLAKIDLATDTIAERPQSASAKKPDFEMPSFDQLARVRVQELKAAGVYKKTAEAAVKQFGVGNMLSGSLGSRSMSAERGILQRFWESVAAPKLLIFKMNSEKRQDKRMRFKGFAQLATLDPTWSGKKIAKGRPRSNGRQWDVKSVASWLSKNYGYWKHFSGKTLAREFAKTKGATLDRLMAFATLDKDEDGKLSFHEASAALPTDMAVEGKLQWSKVASVKASDFAELGFPSKMTKNIMSMATGGRRRKMFSLGRITSAKYNTFKLDEALTSFVERDLRPHSDNAPKWYEVFKKEKLSGGLKFYQIADLLPTDQNNGHITVKIHGQDMELHVPTFDEVAGKKGRLEILPSDVESWLKKEEQGMEDKWWKFSDTNQHARKMAHDVVAWGDGSIPGVSRRGFVNGRIQGSAAGESEQWSDVAPRLALFVHLDRDHDGDIDFSEAYPYLMKAI